MANEDSHKNKPLTLQDRQDIQDCLNHGMTIKAIGRKLGKDQTTISKEIKKHISIETRADSKPNEAPCPLLRKAPFVCNPCEKRRYCRKTRNLYAANKAHNEYLQTLRECREGIPFNKEDFYRNDRLISEGIKRGQHLYHILQVNNLHVSKSTVYRHLQRGYLSVAPIDLPRVVKFKPRRIHASQSVPRAVRLNRTYEDFQTFRDMNSVTAWVEMDTVVGRIGGKAILTFDFTMCNFMAGFLLDSKSAAAVSAVVCNLKELLLAHGESFGTLFPVILTDNGGEFSDVSALENSPDGAKEAQVFFCDPNRSSQKPHVEKNHTLLREIVPSGHSFDWMTQSMVSYIFSNVNGVKRKSQGSVI